MDQVVVDEDKYVAHPSEKRRSLGVRQVAFV